MSRYNTGDPVPSNAVKNVSDNAQIVDEIVNLKEPTTPDRFGNPLKTWFGIQQDANSAISAFGYITMDSFQDGATLTLPNQVLRDTVTGEYYRWDGEFPKTVPAGSTPATSGGVGLGFWLSVGDATLRGELSLPDGADLVGLGDTIVGKILEQKIYVVIITGQSNAVGVNSGGPNPASSKVVVWDSATNAWGSSDYTNPPFSRPAPNGNGGNNNIGLAFAHRLVDEYKASKVYIIYDAVGGSPISDWVGNGTSSVRYAAIKAKVEAALNSPDLVAAGKTKIDHLIWAQGEEDAVTDTFTVYRAKFATLDNQFRGESWMEATTPMFVMGMSGLHTRYQVWQAQLNYCENYNRNCIYVNSAGLKTQYDIDGTGDYTHWLGASLWEHGYYRIWNALQGVGASHRGHLTPFYARGVGPWKGESDAVAMFSSLVSIDSATNQFPINAVSAQGSISWGLNCAADGNYSMAGGHTVLTDNTCNYSMGWGRSISFNATADYSAAFGHEQALTESYQFCVGRGHTLSTQYEFAFGRFSKYITAQTNPVVGQVGIGSASTRKNALTVRDDGAVEIFVKSAHDPAQNGEMVLYAESNTQLRIKVRGTDGVVRSASLTMA